MASAATPGASRMSDIAREHLEALNAGTAEARTLTEALAIDHGALLRAAVPDAGAELAAAVASAGERGILRRMGAIGAALEHHLPSGQLAGLAEHPSDTVRGWWCFATAADASLDAEALLGAALPRADDDRFTVREWVWMALRPRLVPDLVGSIGLLTPWTLAGSANVRRFASEALRPRGVWAAHIGELKLRPELGEPLLEPLRADPSRYVQDSVANWINDAAKTSPDWARALCGRWLEESPTPETERITGRALRSLR